MDGHPGDSGADRSAQRLHDQQVLQAALAVKPLLGALLEQEPDAEDVRDRLKVILSRLGSLSLHEVATQIRDLLNARQATANWLAGYLAAHVRDPAQRSAQAGPGQAAAADAREDAPAAGSAPPPDPWDGAAQGHPGGSTPYPGYAAPPPRPPAPAPPARQAPSPAPAGQPPQPGAQAWPVAAPPGPEPYDQLVRRTFAETVHPGRLLFNPPDHMRLGQTERVEVRLTRSPGLDADLLQHLRGPGQPQLEDVPTAPLMAVSLVGDGFQIAAYSDQEQSVGYGEVTTWEFDIRALKRGRQRLVICVSLRIPVPGQASERRSIPVREAVVDVQVGAPALAGQFVAHNWQWFIGTAVAIAAVVAAVLFH